VTGTVVWQRLDRPALEVLHWTDDHGVVFGGRWQAISTGSWGGYGIASGSELIRSRKRHASIYGPMRATATVISSEAARESGRLTAWCALTLRTPAVATKRRWSA
jgi:hypothetical protein